MFFSHDIHISLGRLIFVLSLFVFCLVLLQLSFTLLSLFNLRLLFVFITQILFKADLSVFLQVLYSLQNHLTIYDSTKAILGAYPLFNNLFDRLELILLDPCNLDYWFPLALIHYLFQNLFTLVFLQIFCKTLILLASIADDKRWSVRHKFDIIGQRDQPLLFKFLSAFKVVFGE
jgi:hypothetical protein